MGKNKNRGRKKKRSSGGSKKAGAGSEAGGGGNTLQKTSYFGIEGNLLVLGDGDFSFSRGLVAHMGKPAAQQVVASSYETKEEVVGKYGEKADDCIKFLEKAGAEVRFEIDARKLGSFFKGSPKADANEGADAGGGGGGKAHRKRKRPQEEPDDADAAQTFERIIFNFPHTGQQMTHVNRAMLRNFFLTAIGLLHDENSEIHVTLKLKFPYTSWDTETSAKTAGLMLTDTLDFDASVFSGYNHRTTRKDATAAGVTDKDKRHCKTFVYRKDPAGAPEHDVALSGWGISTSEDVGLSFMSMIAPSTPVAEEPAVVAGAQRVSSIEHGYVDVATWAKRKASRKKKSKKRKTVADAGSDGRGASRR